MLIQTLTGANDRENALWMLVQTPPSLVVFKPLLGEVLDGALDSANLTTIDLARQLITHYHADAWVRFTLPVLAARYLPANDEWHYRRLAELYGILNYQAELTDLLLLCKASPNVEIQELCDDFPRP